MSEFKSDFGTEETLKKLLDKILESPGEPFLIYKVDPDGDLVTGGGTTWLSLSSQIDTKIAWCLMDDEGKYELETYEPDITGLDQCLDEVYSRQDEINELEKFKEQIIKDCE
jgi:hypothetical protein